MRSPRSLMCLFLTVLCGLCSAFELQPRHVAVIYNGKSTLSRRMAEEYIRVRNIPKNNLVELNCPQQDEISRAEFEHTMLIPLKQTARERSWWKASGSPKEPILERDIYVLALMADLPMKIRHEFPALEPGKNPDNIKTDRAAVDSELSLLVFDVYEKAALLANPYFEKDEEFVGSGLPIFLVCRLDAISPAACMRLVTEPASVEKRGLWGWAVVDRGGPYAQGDQWLDKVADSLREAGIPLFWDKRRQTLPTRFPLSTDTALYFGWYSGAADGPFKDQEFRFRPGAVAMHLHSYSAASFHTPGTGWSSALIELGADVTVGNVYEPFLGATHRFDIFVSRLLAGYSVAEAGWMSMPVLSWQGVLFGDPLYRPFARMKSFDVPATPEDRFFQGWWASRIQFGDRWSDRKARLQEAADKAPDSIIREALALELMYRKEYPAAQQCLNQALTYQADPRNHDRLLLETLMLAYDQGGDKACIPLTDSVKARMKSERYHEALDEWTPKKQVPPPANQNKNAPMK